MASHNIPDGKSLAVSGLTISSSHDKFMESLGFSKMNSGVGRFFLGIQILTYGAIGCQSPFDNILGVCLHFPVNKTTRWCEAQAYCSTVGGELVYGSSFRPLSGQIFPQMPTHYWIGLTDYLHERYNNRTGWRWTDGTIASSSEIIWIGTEPGLSGYGDCAFQCWDSGKICDVGCDIPPNWIMTPMCQPRTPPNSAGRATMFSAAPIPVGLPSFAYAVGRGCSKTVREVTIMECSMLCSGDADDWCVAFYFNLFRNECQLVFYTDANLYQGNANGWVKFTKVKN